MKNIIVVKPKGYCTGVKRAIEIAKEAKKKYKSNNVYVLGMLVHNQKVIDELNLLNIITLSPKNEKDKIDLINKLKAGDVLIFTAHGHDKNLELIAQKKQIITIDATCPIVNKNIKKIKEAIKNKKEILYLGESNHPETNAYLSISDKVQFIDIGLPFIYQKTTNIEKVLISQTTLNINDLFYIESKLKNIDTSISSIEEVCSTTRERQSSVLSIPIESNIIIVIGDKRSSNSKRLFELAKSSHPSSKCLFINDKNELRNFNFKNSNDIYLVSGASTPPELIDDIYNFIKE